MSDFHEVYVKTDQKNNIISVNSSAFVSFDWGIKIDEGAGDKYHHAQVNYFDKPIYTEDGIPCYKLVDGQAVERTEAEIQADRDKLPPAPPSQDDRLAALEAALLVMMGV